MCSVFTLTIRKNQRTLDTHLYSIKGVGYYRGPEVIPLMFCAAFLVRGFWIPCKSVWHNDTSLNSSTLSYAIFMYIIHIYVLILIHMYIVGKILQEHFNALLHVVNL